MCQTPALWKRKDVSGVSLRNISATALAVLENHAHNHHGDHQPDDNHQKKMKASLMLCTRSIPLVSHPKTPTMAIRISQRCR